MEEKIYNPKATRYGLQYTHSQLTSPFMEFSWVQTKDKPAYEHDNESMHSPNPSPYMHTSSRRGAALCPDKRSMYVCSCKCKPTYC